MPQMPIPSDWDGESWTCILIDWPNSEYWLSILRGFLTTPLRGRFWDGRSGSIISAQAIGEEIAERNSDIMSCQDIVNKLDELVTAIQNIDVSQENNVTVQTEINTSIQALITNTVSAIQALSLDLVNVNLAVATAQSSAYAWSQSFAQNITPVHIINSVAIQMRPIEPGVTEAPTTSEETEAGISSTPQSMDELEVCKRVFWMVAFNRDAWRYIADGRASISGSILSWAGLIADALAASAVKAPGGTRMVIIAASVLIQAAHLLGKLQEQNFVVEAIDGIADWLTDEFEFIVCQIADRANNEISTKAIQDWILAEAENSTGLGSLQLGLLKLFFNLGTLATLYFVSPLVDAAPDIPPPYTSSICTSCLE